MGEKRKPLTAARRRQILKEIMHNSGMTRSATPPNPIIEQAIGRKIGPPSFSIANLTNCIGRVLASTHAPVTPEGIADAIARAGGFVLAGDKRLSQQIRSILRVTPGLAVETRLGWWAADRPLPAAPEQPQQPQPRQAEPAPKVNKDGETLDPEGQSRRMQRVWQQRDYIPPEPH